MGKTKLPGGVQLPEGPLGAAIKLLAGAIAAFWWTSGPGAEEARCVVAVEL
jgi:hypothetical protein